MIRMSLGKNSCIYSKAYRELHLGVLLRLFICFLLAGSAGMNLPAAGSDAPSAVATNLTHGFDVRAYKVEGASLPPADALANLLFQNTGTNVGVEVLVQAASDVLANLQSHGGSNMSIVIGEQEITNGLVKMHVIQGAVSQIVVSGKRYPISTNNLGIASNPVATNAPAATAPTPVTNATIASITNNLDAINAGPRANIAPGVRVTPEAMTLAQDTLEHRMAEMATLDRRTRMLPNSKTNFLATTNSQVFEIKGYDLIGNTLLPVDVTELVFEPFVGPKMTFDHVRQALSDLQIVYRDRGYVTVSVSLPPQKLTNGIVKIRVFEGLVTDIVVANNHYFSSNNVIRALPGLHTNMLLTSQVFQAELDRANANQDRQIYPEMQPGPEENTTLLRLKVKDRFPLHAKVELNNQSSPGTPQLRVNSSAVYNNLWQLEHSMGLQYSFSPELYKSETPQTKWTFPDRPQVANYSGFYRMPLGDLGTIADDIAARPGSFGYDEATRKFRLPPPSSRPELNFYASRATIDTGLMTTYSANIYNTNGNILDRRDVQQDFTVNNSFGSRLSLPLPSTENLQSGFSGSFDYKTYNLDSHKTNIFSFTQIVVDPATSPPQTNIYHSVVNSPVGVNGLTSTHLEYLPLSLRYDAGLRDSAGITGFGLGVSANAWHSGSSHDLHSVTGSAKSSGHWVVLNPSISRDISLYKNWTLSLHAEGQWASEPLVSNEQFGLGGVANVRGYREGEVFGDNGWRVNLELKMPPHLVGLVYRKEALTVRPTVYMDYGRAYLLDPQGRAAHTSLWGAGFGAVATVGTHWDARFLCSWPLISTIVTSEGLPRFNFALTAQF
jgi:hemolysin activation/secretion protein